MDDLNRRCDRIKNKILDSAPDIWEKLKKSAARYIAEQLIKEINGVPSNCGKLIFEQVNEIPVVRKVA
jgi:hypothetical protein